MDIVKGQGLFGKIRFVDGEMPLYDRTYLVVNVQTDYIEVLNVSSVKGKERKLAFTTNERIVNYNPPFYKPSFVKLDSLIKVYKSDLHNIRIMCEGKTINESELSKIIRMLQSNNTQKMHP